MIARDKKVHFLAGALAGFAGGAISYTLLRNKIDDSLAVTVIASAFALALIAGFVKELYDLFIKETEFSFMDLLATSVGGVAASLLWFGCSFLKGF